MRPRWWPWRAALIQGFVAHTYLIAVFGVDVAWTAYLDFIASQSAAASGTDDYGDMIGLGLVFLFPVVMVYYVILLAVPLWTSFVVCFVVGLPLRLIPGWGRLWLKLYVPWILLVASTAGVIAGWLLFPPTGSAEANLLWYTPSSTLFLAAALVGAFAVWHIWLPPRAAAAASRPDGDLDGGGVVDHTPGRED